MYSCDESELGFVRQYVLRSGWVAVFGAALTSGSMSPRPGPVDATSGLMNRIHASWHHQPLHSLINHNIYDVTPAQRAFLDSFGKQSVAVSTTMTAIISYLGIYESIVRAAQFIGNISLFALML